MTSDDEKARTTDCVADKAIDHACQTIEGEQVAGWIEMGCWTALVLTPFLYWVNGPAVSQDQLVVRWIVVIVAMGGAIGLRIRCWSRAA